jgi:anaerobic selenocysteine-containing dehydrogenase
MNRRSFMKLSAAAGLALIPVSNLAVAAEVPLSPENATAKALGYVVNSTVTGSNCANCAQAKGDPKALGCNLFPGKQVSATGWCEVWSKKA